MPGFLVLSGIVEGHDFSLFDKTKEDKMTSQKLDREKGWVVPVFPGDLVESQRNPRVYLEVKNVEGDRLNLEDGSVIPRSEVRGIFCGD